MNTVPLEPSGEEPAVTFSAYDTSSSGGAPFRVLSLSGRVHSIEAPLLEKELLAAEAPGRHVVVECAGLRILTSAGLRAFLTAARAMTGTGRVFRIAALRPEIAQLFVVTGFDRLIDLYPDVAGALTAPVAVP